jgi:hypothetical protein
MNQKKPRAELFKFTANMNDRGNIELDMDVVNPDEFTKIMEAGMPSFENTFEVASLIRYLQSMGNEMMDKSRRYL